MYQADQKSEAKDRNGSHVDKGSDISEIIYPIINKYDAPVSGDKEKPLQVVSLRQVRYEDENPVLKAMRAYQFRKSQHYH